MRAAVGTPPPLAPPSTLLLLHLPSPLPSPPHLPSPPRRVPFIEEPCHDFFGPGEIPGYLLFNIILGRPDDVEKAGRGGKLIQPIEKKYQLRFHLYMAKFLPAKDENGLSDPYVLLKYYGKTLKSSVKAETCNPTWYETITDFVAVPEPLELAPPITCMVYDEDKFSKDDLIGRFHIELNKEILAGGATPATPKWHNLVFEKPGDVSGKVLASVTLVPEEKADSAPLPQLKPDTVQATVEVTAIGPLRAPRPPRPLTPSLAPHSLPRQPRRTPPPSPSSPPRLPHPTPDRVNGAGRSSPTEVPAFSRGRTAEAWAFA